MQDPDSLPNLISEPDQHEVLSRPDQIAHELAQELILSAKLFETTFADARYEDAFTHLQNASATVSELMKAFTFTYGVNLNWTPENTISNQVDGVDFSTNPRYLI